LPAWLDVKRPEPKKTQVDLDKIFGPPPESKSVSVEEYRERVKQTKTPQDIRDLHRELANANLDNWLCSIEDFDHLLARYLNLRQQLGENQPDVLRSLDFLLEYIEDERMEHSEGQNIKKLLTTLKSQGEVSVPQLRIIRHYAFDLLRELTNDTRSGRKDTLEVFASLLAISARTAKKLSQPSIMLQLFEEFWCVQWKDMHARKMAVTRIVPCLVDLPITSRTIYLATAIINDIPWSVLNLHKEAIALFVRNIITYDSEQQIPADSSQTEGSNLSAFLTGFEKKVVADFAPIVTLALAHSIRDEKQSAANLRHLCAWADTLRSVFGCVWHVGLNPTDTELALDDIAAGRKPADVPFVFYGLQGKGITRIWVRHWFAQAQLAPGFGHVLVNEESRRSLEDGWMHSFAKLERSSGHLLNLNQVALSSLVKAAQTHGLDWEALLMDLMNLAKVLSHGLDIGAMVRGLKRLAGKSTLTIRHRAFLVDFINQESSRNVISALRTFNTDSRLFLSDQPNLVPALLADSTINPGPILVLLTQADRYDQVVHGLREHDPTCSLSDERVDLIHKVALAIATSDTFTLREASSSVHYCWKLLKRHRAPIDERLAQAAVIAGVLRPLAAENWIPTKQFQWTLSVVASIHGDEAASKIDRMAYAMRPKRTWHLSPPSEQLLRHPAKGAWRDIGGLTPLQRKVVGGRDVPWNKEWLYTKAAKDTIRRSSRSNPTGEQVRIYRLRFRPQKTEGESHRPRSSRRGANVTNVL